jgi:protein-L-isoaspartate(D-aspartate) O-methyltransferase
MFVSRRITFALSALLWFEFNLLASPSEQDFAVARQHMVEDQIKGRGVTDSRVTEVMSSVPRHEFVPEDYRARAYQDHPLPIGYGQTISQPYIVAFMTEQLRPQPTDRVLEIGTGSGYQAAVLSNLVAEVYTIEILKPLAQRAEVDLRRLNYSNVKVKAGDGYKGWPEHAPFDAIIVTAAPDHVPQPLIDQLKEGGRMIIPVGGREMQQLYLLEKHAGKLTRRAVLPVNFVPLTREQ